MARNQYSPIADYGLIGDGQSAALVSRQGSIDWCCLPRFDSGSCFGRLLDWERGGYFSIAPVEGAREASIHRTYRGDTMVLETRFRVEGGEAVVIDCMTMSRQGPTGTGPQILRVIEGVRGSVDFEVEFVPRYDYGEIDAWIRQQGPNTYSGIGGDDGLVISGDLDLEPGEHDVRGRCTVRASERVRVAVAYADPASLEEYRPEAPRSEELDRALDDTIAFWENWVAGLRVSSDEGAETVRSALALKALIYDRTGALVAAPTCSLPEVEGGERNFDYRYSWIRDSTLAARSLGDLGCDSEADAFRRFIERSAAGNAADLQIMYGLGGERRQDELDLDLEGYDGAKPVRIGNEASTQVQLDILGQLVEQSWRWYERGHEPDDDYWKFIVDIANSACERWREPDRGIWEWRGEPRHFTHSKVLCWVALDRALALAKACMRKAPERRWRAARDEIRETIERRGYEKRRGVFVQIFDEKPLDAALLRLPVVGFIDYDDERMVRTADAIREELDADGLLYRHRSDDGLDGQEGAFLPASFWLTEVLARQSRIDEAQEVFDRTVATANGLGLFSEEYDPRKQRMLGNFPQALTHLSHIEAALALQREAEALTTKR
ncbi:MAG TPA: glycoside hydrolase family 15 protein [Solirubrobacterales bacterium]|nr:glycoside hydrolase family 15 protein [Solirubrobacterales bacterium]